jgi:4-amino-4-deoxy-L-arabinose transferase-like glycosyltransferase
MVLALSALLECLNLASDGIGNPFFATAAVSMGVDAHHFWYACFDPSCFLAVDKPPVALWTLVAGVKLLGVNSYGLLLPIALAAVLCVAFVLHAVRRQFGSPAGLMAGLALALTPISVVVGRDNMPDGILALLLVLAAWVVLRAPSLGPLLAGCTLLGIAIQTKGLLALLPLPAFALSYVYIAPRSWRWWLPRLVLALLVLLAAGCWWITAVDLTPIHTRPHVASTVHDSEWELLFGVNGFSRLSGDVGSSFASRQPDAWPGPDGPLRLLASGPASQILWWWPLALIGGFMAWRAGQSEQRRALVLWGGWCLTALLVFSIAGYIHPYYLVVMAPPLAALVGSGVLALWQHYRAGDSFSWLLCLALLCSAVFQVTVLLPFSDWRWCLLGPLITLVAALALALIRRSRRVFIPGSWLALGLLGLLVSPAVWCGIPIRDGLANLALPYAGPVADRPSAADRPTNHDLALLAYLEAHRGSAQYLASTLNARQASPLILAGRAPVLAMGGYTGDDRLLTIPALQGLVASRSLRFALSLSRRPADVAQVGSGNQGDLTAWLWMHCVPVPDDVIDATPARAPTGDPPAWRGLGWPEVSGLVLLDCAAKQ